MPVSSLSSTQRERYGHYPDTLSSEELARYFHLDDDDREWIATRRRVSSQFVETQDEMKRLALGALRRIQKLPNLVRSFLGHNECLYARM